MLLFFSNKSNKDTPQTHKLQNVESCLPFIALEHEFALYPFLQ